MTEEEFNALVDRRLDLIREVLITKGKEYRRNNDPLHNFNVASRINNTTREKALWGFALKHYVSFLDMLDDIEKNKLPKKEYVEEKIGDLINYLILCEASIKDRMINDSRSLFDILEDQNNIFKWTTPINPTR
jgi:hypothetical protein